MVQAGKLGVLVYRKVQVLRGFQGFEVEGAGFELGPCTALHIAEASGFRILPRRSFLTSVHVPNKQIIDPYICATQIQHLSPMF